jgi:hypothetical protein
MKANNTHISLETARLLKDCGIKSSLAWNTDKAFIGDWGMYSAIRRNLPHEQEGYSIDQYPAYTWQEILWEYPEKFFGKPFDFEDDTGDFTYHMATRDILHFLQHKQYDEADKYFRENCILINE